MNESSFSMPPGYNKCEIEIKKKGMDAVFCKKNRFEIYKSKIGNARLKWRREQDSNLQALTGGSFQDYCITNYAISPHAGEFKIYRKIERRTNPE